YLASAPPGWCDTTQQWPFDAVTVAADHARAGRLREAIVALDRAIALDAGARARLGPRLASLHVTVAEDHLRAGRLREAIVAYERAIALDAGARARLGPRLASWHDEIATRAIRDVALKGKPTEGLKDALPDAEQG